MNKSHFIDMNHLTVEQFKHIFDSAQDVTVFTKRYTDADLIHAADNNPANFNEEEIIFVYCDSIINHISLNETILPAIAHIYKMTKFNNIEHVEKYAVINWIKVSSPDEPIDVHTFSKLLYEGSMLCVFPKLRSILAISIPRIPTRTPDESATEPSIRGPKDGLIEDIGVNISLIRKRLRSEDLACETYFKGSLTETKLVLMYMENIANDEIIKSIKERIDKIDVEQIITTGHLEELISTSSFFTFPTVDYSSRPDFIVNSLLDGRFILLLENNPSAMIAPGNLFGLLKSPEDTYFPLLSSNIGRIFRLTALFATIFLPAFFIAITTFHPEQIPFKLLATISISRQGLPMEAALEMFIIMVLMELFREASIRLPSSIGQTLTVVGGLIIGEASIRAGIVSPIIIVISAITLVASSTLVNQSLSSTVVMVRFITFLFGAVLGMYGFFISLILFLLYLSKINSFGVPYLAPLSPLNWRTLLPTLFEVPLSWMTKRSNFLHTKKPRKDG